MRLLIVSMEKQREVNRVMDEASRRGHVVKFRLLKKGLKVNPNDYDALLLRAIRGKSSVAKRIAKLFLNHKKIVVDEKIGKGMDRDKVENYELFRKAGLFVPGTVYFTKRNVPKIMDFASRFIVLKPVKGKRGMGLLRVSRRDIQYELEELKGKHYLAQEFVEIKKEFRVFVMGNKVIGGMEKATNFWIHNIHQGAKPKLTVLSKAVEQAALKATKAVATEIAGVDVAVSPNGLFVVEVNRSPNFRGYESLGNNLAIEVVKYLEEKLSKRDKKQ